MATPSYEFYNPVIYQQWLFTADKIERDPSLLEIGLVNIARWIKSGRLVFVGPLKRWREIILEAQRSPEGMAALLALLRDDGEDARFMKSCSPFPGVLTKQERRMFPCAWTH